MAARLVLVAAVLISLLLAQAHHVATHPVDEPDAGSFSPSLTSTGVDLALVLAVDVSPSMEFEEQELQRQGFVEAFRSTEVHNAIRKGRYRSDRRHVCRMGGYLTSGDRRSLDRDRASRRWVQVRCQSRRRLHAARQAHIHIERHRFRCPAASRKCGPCLASGDRYLGEWGEQPRSDGNRGPRRSHGARHHCQWIADHAEATRRLLGNRGAGPLLSRLRHRRPGSVPDPGSRAEPVCRGHQAEDRARDCRSPAGPGLGAACRGRSAQVLS